MPANEHGLISFIDAFNYQSHILTTTGQHITITQAALALGGTGIDWHNAVNTAASTQPAQPTTALPPPWPEPSAAPGGFYTNSIAGPSLSTVTMTFDDIESELLEFATGTKETKKNTTFQEIFKYGALKLEKIRHNALEKTLPKPTIPFESSDALFGIEIEVEGCPNPPVCEYYWQVKSDGSLRNYGYEFVSNPLRADQVEHALNYLQQRFKETNGNNLDFSNRTSVHVHMDARHFTQENLWCFTILYSIFEKHFYKFAGTKRESSIFCVPLYKTNYVRNLDDFVYRFRANWSKYCGLNLAPMFKNQQTQTYGTVEFRHLYGTFDPNVIVPWINSIILLRKAALKWKKASLIEELRRMNTVSSYSYLYREIFGEYCLNLNKEDFEFCISQVKKELFRNDWLKKLKTDDECLYFKTIKALGI